MSVIEARLATGDICTCKLTAGRDNTKDVCVVMTRSKTGSPDSPVEFGWIVLAPGESVFMEIDPHQGDLIQACPQGEVLGITRLSLSVFFGKMYH